MDANEVKTKAVKGFAWQLLQNSALYVTKFVITVVLARIVLPEEYGLVALANTFINIAMVFVTTGFSSAIVQKKEITDTDLNTLFYSSIGLGLLLYALLFYFSPAIADFYHERALIEMVRVNALVVVIGMFYSVHQSLVYRRMEYRTSFNASLVGAIFQGATGILFALKGLGAWALVYSSVINYVVCAIYMWIAVRWKPKLEFSFASLKRNLPFSMKILGFDLIDAVFNNLMSLIIGRVYDSESLAYYNKGYQFPQLAMGFIDGASSKVMFSALSKFQDNWEEGLNTLRKELQIVLFTTAPLMFGLYGCADSFIRLMLTDAWAGAIPYVKLTCIICLLWPLAIKVIALNSIGKSGTALVLKTIFNCISIISILLSYRISVYAMVFASMVAGWINTFIMLFVSKRYLQYNIKDQITDIALSILIGFVMGISIEYLGNLMNCVLFIKFVTQVLLGVIIYIGLSWLFNRKLLYTTLRYAKSFLKRN